MIIIMHIYNWYHSITTGIHLHTQIQITMYMVHSPCFIVSPCWFPLLIPLAPLSNPLSNPLSLTWNPPCCDRIRPPRSQVACKLTSPFLTLSPTLPPPNSQNPGYQRLTKTTLCLLSGTLTSGGEKGNCNLFSPPPPPTQSIKYAANSCCLLVLQTYAANLCCLLVLLTCAAILCC
jgi:hypothetical protein